MTQKYIIVGKVTNQEVADLFSAIEGRAVEVGDTEYRVVDDVANPGYSADYASLEAAWRDNPGAILVEEDSDAANWEMDHAYEGRGY